MNIDRFKSMHVEILRGISTLRTLTHSGVDENAVAIAHELSRLSKIIVQHLAIEDRILYPRVAESGDPRATKMSIEYQDDMKEIAPRFIKFSRHWCNSAVLVHDEDEFRREANQVLRAVQERVVRENHEFYPMIEAL